MGSPLDDAMATTLKEREARIHAFSGAVARQVANLYARVDQAFYADLQDVLRLSEQDHWSRKRTEAEIARLVQGYLDDLREVHPLAEEALIEQAELAAQEEWRETRSAIVLFLLAAGLSWATLGDGSSGSLEPSAPRMESTYLSGLPETKARWAHQTILRGLRSGEPANQILARLTGSPDTPGVFPRASTALQTLVRTAIADLHNKSLLALYRKMPLFVSAYRWISVVDEVTTDICLSRHLQVFPVGSGILPPAHMNCRSVIAPVFVSAGP